ncbi:hypothetical protein EYR36_000415 [Pleurotus pulmonarius]|nr:hypothetical protein EYR36_000415 [Pleurotus pulmonarius]
MQRLPPEIKRLVLQEILDGWDLSTLRNCALVCKSWHESCLPVLFHSFTISVDNGRHLPACSRLLAESPYIRQHIRKVVFESKDFPIYVPDEERRMIESILLGLPRLDELLCTSISLETLSSTLPQLSITKLYLKVEVYSALPILPVLNAIAATVRSLTLEELIFGDELTENEFTTIIKNGPIRMTALEELAIVLCANLPLASKFIQMPNLKALYCAGVDTALGDGILCALQTLVVAEAEVSGRSSA